MIYIKLFFTYFSEQKYVYEIISLQRLRFSFCKKKNCWL